MNASQPVAAQAYLASLRAAFDGVVEWIFRRGQLQQFPRVLHYTAKTNGGPGWEDSYQNLLIERICSSRWMKRETDAFWSCLVDESEWYRESDEWRMNAYKERLTEVRGGKQKGPCAPVLGLPPEDKVYFSDDFFSTVGFESSEAEKIDLRGIVRYLTELRTGEYLDLEGSQSAGRGESPRLSVWQRIWRIFRG